MKKSNLHGVLAALIAALGALLMVYMILAEDEPGAIPLMMIGFGVGWYLVTRLRARAQHE